MSCLGPGSVAQRRFVVLQSVDPNLKARLQGYGYSLFRFLCTQSMLSLLWAHSSTVLRVQPYRSDPGKKANKHKSCWGLFRERVGDKIVVYVCEPSACHRSLPGPSGPKCPGSVPKSVRKRGGVRGGVPRGVPGARRPDLAQHLGPEGPERVL